jgi:hypothetical protein
MDPAEHPLSAADFGWRFDRDAGARLHLQSTTSSHRVWLERDGHRTFEPEAALEMNVFERLEVLVSRSIIRRRIEQAWIERMIREGWLELEWISELSLVLCAYPGRAVAFRRHIELRPARRTAATAASAVLRPLYPEDLRLCGTGALQLWEHEIPLSSVLWGQRGPTRRINVRCRATCCRGSWNDAADCWAVTCSGQRCEVPACPARADGIGERNSELQSRVDFKYATENVLHRALLLHYRVALQAKHDVALFTTERGDQLPDGRVTRLIEAELVPLIAQSGGSDDCRRAYGEVVRSLSQSDSVLQRSAELLVLQNLDRRKLSHALDRQDTLSFWRRVTDVLEGEWTQPRAPAKRAGRLEDALGSRSDETRFVPRTDAIVLIRNVAGHDWGWLSCEDNRMYLQTLERGALSGPNEVRVWLEERGVRAFVIARGELSRAEVDELRAAVNLNRPNLEASWVCFMANQTRLDATLSGHLITLTAYSGSPQEFIRRIDLRRHFPGAYSPSYFGPDNWHENPPLIDWDYGNGLLAVGHEEDTDHRSHILVDFLFED